MSQGNNTKLSIIIKYNELIFFSNTEQGIQKQLDGLKNFCNNNKMIVNETKTEVMHFGKKCCSNVYFNGKRIEQVTEYKYLGNIIRAAKLTGKM